MVEEKAFIHLGEKRYTRYDLNIKIQLVQKVTVSDQGIVTGLKLL